MTTYKYTFYYENQIGNWVGTDRYGSGDITLTPAIVRNFVIPAMGGQRAGITEAGHDYYTKPLNISIDGFGPTAAVFKMYIKDDTVHRATLLTVDGNIIRDNIEQFQLVMEYIPSDCDTEEDSE